MSLIDKLSDIYEEILIPAYSKIEKKLLKLVSPFVNSAIKKIVSFYEFALSKLKKPYEKYLKAKVEKVISAVDAFQVKYLNKGQIKESVLVRYMVKELLLYFGVAFLFFFMIFFCNQILLLAESILKKRVPFGDVSRLMLYTFPAIIAQSTPFATLVGFLMCLGRLMTDNEVLIIRASGQSYAIVMVPVLILGLAISVASFFVNDYLQPVGTINYNKLYRQILASNPAVEIESNTIKHFNNSVIVIGEVTDNKVSDLVFFDRGKDGKQRIIVSGNATLLSAKKDGVLMQMNMNDSVVAVIDPKTRDNFDVIDSAVTTLNIFDSSVFGNNYSTSPREMTSFDLGRSIKNMKERGDYNKRILNRYIMEFNRKFAQPFGSLFFAMLAIPLALLFGKHNGQTIGLFVGVFIAVLYWVMMVLGSIFSSRNGLNPVGSMWFPDMVIFVTALLFYVVLKKK